MNPSPSENFVAAPLFEKVVKYTRIVCQNVEDVLLNNGEVQGVP